MFSKKENCIPVAKSADFLSIFLRKGIYLDYAGISTEKHMYSVEPTPIYIQYKFAGNPKMEPGLLIDIKNLWPTISFNMIVFVVIVIYMFNLQIIIYIIHYKLFLKYICNF